jgi:hypothetical protein
MKKCRDDARAIIHLRETRTRWLRSQFDSALRLRSGRARASTLTKTLTCGSFIYVLRSSASITPSSSMGVRPSARISPSKGSEIVPPADRRTSRFISGASNTEIFSKSSAPMGSPPAKSLRPSLPASDRAPAADRCSLWSSCRTAFGLL